MIRHTIGLGFGGQQTGQAPASAISAFTGSSIGMMGGGALRSGSGKPGLILLALAVVALVGFSYWTR